RGPPGVRPPLAIDPNRRGASDFNRQGRAGDALRFGSQSPQDLSDPDLARSFDVITDPIEDAGDGGRVVGRAERLVPGQGHARARGPDGPGGRRDGAEVHTQGSTGQGALARRIPREGEGRPGFLPLGRLVTLLPRATGPVATRLEV